MEDTPNQGALYVTESTCGTPRKFGVPKIMNYNAANYFGSLNELAFRFYQFSGNFI